MKQVDFKDCGACCILSILKYYGGFVPLEKVKIDTVTNTDGTTAYHLVETLKKYNFDANGLKIELNDLVENKLVFPLIAHVTLYEKFNHFVVVLNINNKKKIITIMDPAYGERNLTFEEFTSIWNNIVITAYPISMIPKYDSNKSIIQIILNAVKSEKNLVTKILICSFILTLFSILSGFYYKVAVNNISLFKSKRYLLIIALIFLVIFLLKVIVNYLRNHFENYFNKNLDIKIILPFINHILFLPLNYVKSKSTGEIVTRIQELNNIKELFSKVLITIFIDLFLAFSTLFILYNVNNKLFLILFIILFIYIILSIVFIPIINHLMNEGIILETNYNAEIIENIEGLETIKNINKYSYFIKKIEITFIKYLTHSFKYQNSLNIFDFSKNLVLEIGIYFIYSWGFYLVLKAKLELVDLITFIGLINYSLEPVKNITEMIPKISFIKLSLNKISDFILIKGENLEGKKEKFKNCDLKFDKVSFSYDKYKYIIKDLSFNIKSKEHVMLRGKSGAGKSTLCKCLYRLFEINDGVIKIGDINIKDYDLSTIRNNIIYLSQKEILFNETIKNNILLSEEKDNLKLNEVIDICGINSIVIKKQGGINSMLIDGANNLSGGERQRIKLARALLKESQIVILDEALSETNKELEENIIKKLRKYLKDKTLIYITHRNHENLFERVIEI